MNPCYMETLKCSSPLFGARKKRLTAISSHKNLFTALWSTKKWILIFRNLKKGSELFHSRNIVSQLFGEGKKWIPAIWSPKTVVSNTLEQGKIG